jgi:dTDP-4-dehydrorhamnose 3,5-epimerase
MERVLTMQSTSIEGVSVQPLRQIPDERGKIMHMLRRDATHFEGFGEIYFSTVYPGAIKAWHLHREMTLNYAVVSGMIKLVLYDDREGSATRGNVVELFIGEQNYCLVTVPPMVWNGFKGIGGSMAIVANCATIPHDPDEISRLDPFSKDIPYKWDIRHG